jgi:hypothetical protein
MKRFSFCRLLVLATISLFFARPWGSMGVSAWAQSDRTTATYELHSAMPAYWQFLKEDADAQARSSVERFRALVVHPNREAFRSVAATSLNERSLERVVRFLNGRTQEMHRVDDEFAARFDKSWRRFAEFVPDLKAGALIFLLPAPRSMIGGSVRPLGDKDAVILGTEEIALAMKSKTGFDVLVQHELTHLYHQQVNPEMRQMVAEVYMPPFAEGRAKLYQVMWLEGLAVYTSKHLNPTAPDREVLVSNTLAADVKSRWPRLGAEVRKCLDSTKKADIDAFHFAPDVHRPVPRRTGYYVGMLVARQLAKKYTFPEMCRLAGPKLRAEIEQALLELEKTDVER